LFSYYSSLFLKKNVQSFCSTRVSNELGAGNSQAAKMAVWAIMVIAITEAIIISTALFFCRHIMGYAFSSEKQIVNYVADMVPFICLSVIMDCLQSVLSGKRCSFFSFIDLLGQEISFIILI
jgi:MATE family multidrug resistance protein